MKKSVLITGSSKGIGLALAKSFDKKEWNVIATTRDVDEANELQKLDLFRVLSMDVTNENSIHEAAQSLGHDFALHVLVNNAGIAKKETLESLNKDDLIDQLETNVVGPLLVTKAFLPQLQRAGKCSGKAVIANISSVMGSIHESKLGGMYGYRASKAALNMINKSLSIDFSADNVISIAIDPGYVQTAMTEYHGEITAEQSAVGIVQVIEKCDLQSSGKFVDHEGRLLSF